MIKGVDIMLRMTSLDSMAKFDCVLDKFEDLSRHGYSFDKILDMIDNDYDCYDHEDFEY